MGDYIKWRDVFDLICATEEFYTKEEKGAKDYLDAMFYIGAYNAITAIEDGLSDIPTAKVREDVQGEWGHEEEGMGWTNHTCSVCSFAERTWQNIRFAWNFCPNCGARMGGYGEQ